MYKIKVEADNPDFSVDKRLQEGRECEGFLVIGVDEEEGRDKTTTTFVVEQMTTVEIALAMASQPVLREAMCIAMGFLEAKKLRDEENERTAARARASIMSSLFAKGDEDDE